MFKEDHGVGIFTIGGGLSIRTVDVKLGEILYNQAGKGVGMYVGNGRIDLFLETYQTTEDVINYGGTD